MVGTQTAPMVPKAGQIISKTTKFAGGIYRLPHADETGKTAAIEIRGRNITVDFGGLFLEGTSPMADPDQRKGTAIRVQGDNITIKNLNVKGYKIGLIADGCRALKIENCDFSYNWKQKLRSTLEREDLSDWMSFHRNEKDEWLRFGAAVYLKRCTSFEISKVTAVGGQCGLMMTDCNEGVVRNNNFSFLSAIGIGMYRSSNNVIEKNKVDWCVRGYSHGVYNRGQDSAGILIYEQSHRNVFAFNSVTHGGDGFFLWAGQTTMDTGKGGCNDNVLVNNDFSHAPTNGIEATFSRNIFENNLLLECWHGIWGGYSYDSIIKGNIFGYNGEAIAIEHGQNNSIFGNTFANDGAAINLWQNARQDPNWGYPKNRDTQSHGYVIRENSFTNIVGPVLAIRDTRDVIFENNVLARVAKPFSASGNMQGMKFEGNTIFCSREAASTIPNLLQNMVTSTGSRAEPPTPSVMPTSGNPNVPDPADTATYLKRFEAPGFGADKGPFLPKGTLRGRRYILVDEWGPYDFQRPIVWLRDQVERAGVRVLKFEVLGPKGKWSRKGARNCTLPQSGAVPGWVEVSLAKEGDGSVSFDMEYLGARTVDYRGVATPAGKPFRFGWSKFDVPIQWDIKWFSYDPKTQEPRTMTEAFAELLANGTPIKTERTTKLEYAWGGAIGPNLPANYFATVAEGAFEIAPGQYELEITTDDGMRCWLDGKPLVEDAWKYQGPTVYSRKVQLGGKHKLLIHHFEIDGYSTLQFRIRPLRQ